MAGDGLEGGRQGAGGKLDQRVIILRQLNKCREGDFWRIRGRGHVRIDDAEDGHVAALEDQGREIRADAEGDVAVCIGRGDEDGGAVERGGGHPVPGLAVGHRQEARAARVIGGALGGGQEDGFGVGARVEAGPVGEVEACDPCAEEGEAAGKLGLCLEKAREAEGLAAGAADIETGLRGQAVAEGLEGFGEAGIGHGKSLRLKRGRAFLLAAVARV